jgi:hypothetical protein
MRSADAPFPLIAAPNAPSLLSPSISASTPLAPLTGRRCDSATQKAGLQKPQNPATLSHARKSAHIPQSQLRRIRRKAATKIERSREEGKGIPRATGEIGLLNSCFFLISLAGLPRFAVCSFANFWLRLRCSGVCAWRKLVGVLHERVGE